LGLDEPTVGKVRHAERLDVAYFSQHRDDLDPEKSVLKTLCPEGDYVDYRGQFVFARSYLGKFLFRPEQMDMPVGKLSGGEQSRLRIAQLMLKSANVLVLDEPTNDLDLSTLEVLEDSLKTFDGAVILVTHDRYFLEQIATEILAFVSDENGQSRLEKFADTLQFENWLESRPRKQKSAPAAPMKTAGADADSALAPSGGKTKRLSYKEKRELEGMEQSILTAENRLAELQAESSNPEVMVNPSRLTALASEMADLEQTIEKLYARWAELES
jgi:ATP-binding cassette subfamily F protein uup